MGIDRKKPGVPFSATVLLVVMLVGYPLSVGPACWISSRATKFVPVVETAYSPMMFICDVSPHCVVDYIQWYSGIGASGRWYWGMKGNWIRDESATPAIRRFMD